MKSEKIKQYEKYKDSGIPWIGEIPEHWEVKKLKYEFKFITGFTPPTGKSEYYEKGTHIWINISDMDKKYIYDSEKKITDKAIEDFNPQLVPKGSLLYSFKLSVGKTAFVLKDCYTNEAIFSVLPKENTNLTFFYHALPEQVIKNANENIYGAKILNQELIKNAYLIIPPKHEQTAIANYLDYKTAEIDELIAKKERLLELYEEEKKAIINKAVTKGLNPNVKMKDSGIPWLGEIPEHWEIVKLRFLCTITTGEKDTVDKDENGIYPFFVRSQVVERISTYSYDGEAILTAGDGVGVGKVFHYINGKFDFHQRVYKLSDFKEIVGLFLFYYMKMKFYNAIIGLSAKSTVDSLRLHMLQNFFVPIPPLKEQQQIVSYIEKQISIIDSKIEKTKKIIELLKEYKTSLISEVVTGKRRVI